MKLKRIPLLACCLFAFASATLADDKDFHDQDLTKKVFNNQILNGANFSDAILKYASFWGASLKKANFKGADITQVNFTNADLTGADLTETTGAFGSTGADLSNANLEGLTVYPGYRTKYRGANLKKCKLIGVIGECDFSEADLRGANLRGAQIANANNRFRKAIYDDDTAWPDGFDPKAEGAILAKAEDAAK